MPWKTEDGKIVADQNGNPIWVHEDGKEAGWNVPAQLATIRDLSEKLKGKKKALSDIESSFGDALKNPDRVKKALATLADIEAGKFKSMKDDEAVKELQEKLKSYRKQVSEYEKSLKAKEKILADTVIDAGIARAGFFKKQNINMPPDIAKMLFGQNFKVEEKDGKPQLVPYMDGEKLFSRKPERAGKVADVNEALEIYFQNYEHKEMFMPAVPSGPGGFPGTRSAGGEIRLTREQAKDPRTYAAAQEKIAKTGGKITIEE